MLNYMIDFFSGLGGIVCLFILFIYFLSVHYIHKTTKEEPRLYILGHIGLLSFLMIIFSETIPSIRGNYFEFSSGVFFFVLFISLIIQALLKIKLNGFTVFKKSLLRKRTLFIIFIYLLMLILLYHNYCKFLIENCMGMVCYSC